MAQTQAAAGSTQEAELLLHTGQCHCGSVKFEYEAPADMVAWDCNCSICAMKRNTHIFVPESRFRLLQGQEDLSLYQFETGVAKHLFCRKCGICSFYRPRSNPDGVAITIYCITSKNHRHITVKHFDGQHWEEAYAATGIAAYSKP